MRVAVPGAFGLLVAAALASAAGCGAEAETETVKPEPMSRNKMVGLMASGARVMRQVNNFEPDLRLARLNRLQISKARRDALQANLWGCDPKATSIGDLERGYYLMQDIYKQNSRALKREFKLSDQVTNSILPEPDAAPGTRRVAEAWNQLLQAEQDYMNPIGLLSAQGRLVSGAAGDAAAAASYIRAGKETEKYKDAFEESCQKADESLPYYFKAYDKFLASRRRVGPLAEAALRVERAFETNSQTRSLKRKLKRKAPQGLGLPDSDGGL